MCDSLHPEVPRHSGLRLKTGQLLRLWSLGASMQVDFLHCRKVTILFLAKCISNYHIKVYFIPFQGHDFIFWKAEIHNE